MHPRNSRIGTCLMIAQALVACDSSIGSDTCTGIGTRCTLPAEGPFDPRLPQTTFHDLSTGDLPSLMPVDEHQLTFPTPRYSGSGSSSLLSGQGRAGLIYARPREDGSAVEIYRLDGSGHVVDQGLILAPTPKDVGSLAQPGLRQVSWSYTRAVQNQGEAPILGIGWQGGDCGGGSLCSIGEELVALRTDLKKPPLRLFPPYSIPAQAARTDDGGLWLFGANMLRKYNSAGEVVISQSLFRHQIPYSTNPGTPPNLLSLISVAPSQALYVWSYDEEGGQPRLWGFDAQGSPRWRTIQPNRDVAVLTDADDRAVVFTTTDEGDLLMERIAASGDRIERIRALRDGYTTLDLLSVTEDAAGNLYALTHTGARDHAVPTLCKLPLAGDLTCFLTPTIIGSHINAGDEGVVYASRTIFDPDPVTGGGQDTSDPNSPELTLQRFEVP